MNKNDPIEVSQVGNGFIVRPSLRTPGMMIAEESQLVFQSYAGLAEWIGQHFDHRAQEIAKDTHNAEITGDEAGRPKASG